MRMTVPAIVAAALTLTAATGAGAYANRYAALAIDYNQGLAYGWSINQYSQGEADRAALRNCGGNCRVVVRFYGGCGAYAVGRGSDIYGWGLAPTKQAAQNRALAEVRSRGGRGAFVRVWACNDN